MQLFILDLLLFRNDEFEPSPRGAWLLPEVHSYALLGWAVICAGLSFCLSSHLLRSVLWIVCFDFLVILLRSRGFVSGPNFLNSKLTSRVLHVSFIHKSLRFGTYYFRSTIKFTCFARVNVIFSIGPIFSI